MTRREELLERCEDAYFAVLMEDVAQQEGRRLEQCAEELLRDPAFAVPESLEQKCRAVIDRHFAQKQRARRRHAVKRVLTHAAVLAALLALGFTTAFAAIPEFRASTLNLVIETYEDHTELSFAEEFIPSEPTCAFSPGWLPEGYSVTDQSANEFHVGATYQNSDGKEIGIDIFTGRNASIGLDTEDADIQSLEIQGHAATLSVKEQDDLALLFWGDPDLCIFVVLNGSSDQAEDLIKIAQNLEIT